MSGKETKSGGNGRKPRLDKYLAYDEANYKPPMKFEEQSVYDDFTFIVVNLPSCLEQHCGSWSFVYSSLKKFVESFPKEYETLVKAVEEDAHGDLVEAAHKVKGGARTLHLPALCRAAAQLERAARFVEGFEAASDEEITDLIDQKARALFADRVYYLKLIKLEVSRVSSMLGELKDMADSQEDDPLAGEDFDAM